MELSLFMHQSETKDTSDQGIQGGRVVYSVMLQLWIGMSAVQIPLSRGPINFFLTQINSNWTFWMDILSTSVY